jgi:glycosyltransferase involved in cell wall biosynthesis
MNNVLGLSKTIQSVINQNKNNYEYIIIDGGSTDGSVDLIKEYENQIHYWISEPDDGIFNAMNKGILKAQGGYCLFLNSGDYLADNNVLDTVSQFHFNEDIIYGQQLVINENKLVITPFLDPEYITLRSFMHSTLPHQCTFIKRELFNKIGLYNESNKIISDWEFTLIALFKYNVSLRKIDIPISVFDASGISNNKNLLEFHEAEKKLALKQNFPRIIIDYHYLLNIHDRYIQIPRIFRKLFRLFYSNPHK